ncbi:hypothetical protein [Ruminococcus sp. Marseille-P6503]|uniref:hypothetical protein n=1 Tax=Ruminococcus sp. Marseille-P6503 TaxID=2364796 RepID=UPI000F527972|nr:hypothetical protein [Ruminococcus sp. Marseille-P6503]
MAEHRIKRDGIIYTIPNDELFERLKSGDAIIDKQGHLVDRKTGNIIKWLDFRADEDMTHVKKSLPQQPVKSGPTVSEGLKQIAVNAFLELIDRAVDKFFYEVLPGVWKEHIVPFCHDVKDALTAKELKVDSVKPKTKAAELLAKQQAQPKVPMTTEEIDAEKRKAVYHWLGMMESLTKLHNAGEIEDLNDTLAQLTSPATLQKVNAYLGENQNLLEVDKYLTLQGLLGRDLYKEKVYVPIEAIEIKQIASSYEQ